MERKDIRELTEKIRPQLAEGYSPKELVHVFGQELQQHPDYKTFNRKETKIIFKRIQEELAKPAPKITTVKPVVKNEQRERPIVSYAYTGIQGIDLSKITEQTTEMYADKLDELGLANADEDRKRSILVEAFRETYDDLYETKINYYPEEKQKELFEIIENYITNYGVLTPALQDPDVKEVMVNGPGAVWVENSEGLRKTDIYFADETSLRKIITKIAATVNRRIDESAPILDCRLEDGSRVNATLSPPTINGPSLTIRRFPEDKITIDKLIDYKSLTPRTARFLEHCIDAALNVLIIGGTGSGKLLDIEHKIPTINGIRRLGDIEVGDMIFDENGAPTRVNNIFEPVPPSVYTVCFDDGSEVVACGEHLWETWDRSARRSVSRGMNTFPERQEFLNAEERIAIKMLPEIFGDEPVSLGEAISVLPESLTNRIRNAGNYLKAVSEGSVRKFSVYEMCNFLQRNNIFWAKRMKAVALAKETDAYKNNEFVTSAGFKNLLFDLTGSNEISVLGRSVGERIARNLRDEGVDVNGLEHSLHDIVEKLEFPNCMPARGLTDNENASLEKVKDNFGDKNVTVEKFMQIADDSLYSRVLNALNYGNVSLMESFSVDKYDVNLLVEWLTRSEFLNDQRHKVNVPEVRDTDEIFDSLKTDSGHVNHSIPVSGVWSFEKKVQTIDPYVFGAWLGDGTSYNGGFSGVDSEIWENIEKAGYEVTHSATNPESHYIKGIVGKLKNLGVIKTEEHVKSGIESKFIPSEFLVASEMQRRDLLAGLMDTDGGVFKETGFCEFYNSNKILIDDVRLLLHSLGYKTRLRTKENPKFSFKGETKVSDKVAYTISFVSEVPVFRLARKEKARIEGLAKVDRRSFVNMHRYIVDVIPWEESNPDQPFPKMRCLQVDSPSSLFLISDAGIPTHNTSMLNALGNFIPSKDRIVTIEDAAELQLQHDHVLKHEARPANIEGEGEITIGELLKSALRQRPDRIIVGECRSGEAFDMLQAMNTGHDGSMSTLHANTPKDGLARLNNLVLQAGVDLSEEAINGLIASALDLIVYCGKLPILGQQGKTRRMVTHITEVLNVEGSNILTQDIYKSNKINNTYYLQPTGIRPQFLSTKFQQLGIVVDPELFQDDPADDELIADQVAENINKPNGGVI